MSVITNNLLQGDDGYNISRSVRLRSAATATFSRTTGTATSATTWTWSAWIKRGTLGSIQAMFSGGSSGTVSSATTSMVYFDNTDVLGVQFSGGASNVATTAVLRDPSAWYHIVVKVAATTATIYVNGVQVAMGSVTPTYINANSTIQYFGYQNYSGSTRYFDGYLTEVNFVDGQALTPSSFGETDSITGVWKAKKYTGTYGTNGFYLNFSDPSAATAAAIGKDYSGNGNNWTPNNISVTSGVTYDSMLDVPTLGTLSSNHCVMNPLASLSGRTSFSAGNLQVLGTSSSESGVDYGTIGVTSGKWYWESTVLAVSSASSYPNFGAVRVLYGPSNGKYPGDSFTGGAGIFTAGTIYKEGSLVTTATSYTTNDIIGIALDLDNLTCAFYKNNTLLSTVTGLTAGTYWAAVASYYNSSTALNFGQRPFAYTPPTGFKALNTQNLPDATIKKGNLYFDAVVRAGATAPTSVTSLAFQPDLLWTKTRSAVTNHNLFDSARGLSVRLQSDNTGGDAAAGSMVTSFNSNGYTFGSDYSGTNLSGSTHVDWVWKESVSAGFDIVTFNGTGGASTVNHSLGVAPKFIIAKCRGTTEDWLVGHGDLGWTKALNLNLTGAVSTSITAWNNTAPTSTQFSINSFFYNATAYVAYLFAEVAGFSKFGSYTGNGSADGPFVYCGFRPRWIMFKATGEAGSWTIIDTARLGYNANNSTLYADTSNGEQGYLPADILSNGFKIRLLSTGTSFNTGGIGYIFAAFAENPFKNSLAR